MSMMLPQRDPSRAEVAFIWFNRILGICLLILFFYIQWNLKELFPGVYKFSHPYGDSPEITFRRRIAVKMFFQLMPFAGIMFLILPKQICTACSPRTASMEKILTPGVFCILGYLALALSAFIYLGTG